ncbi:hypothetical protein B0J18DRAFT_133714 [Chaetomium sp. MPI-SDFR-AT-0129]|nr:hypothetical protein B0J18DRAFT_133714 [Chaetomium sp. MPI-SDFR-AT-0129]
MVQQTVLARKDQEGGTGVLAHCNLRCDRSRWDQRPKIMPEQCTQHSRNPPFFPSRFFHFLKICAGLGRTKVPSVHKIPKSRRDWSGQPPHHRSDFVLASFRASRTAVRHFAEAGTHFVPISSDHQACIIFGKQAQHPIHLLFLARAWLAAGCPPQPPVSILFLTDETQNKAETSQPAYHALTTKPTTSSPAGGGQVHERPDIEMTCRVATSRPGSLLTHPSRRRPPLRCSYKMPLRPWSRSGPSKGGAGCASSSVIVSNHKVVIAGERGFAAQMSDIWASARFDANRECAV